MSISLTGSSFDERTAHPLRTAPPDPVLKSRGAALLVTVAIHVAAGLALLLGVHVAAPVAVPPPMLVHIDPGKDKPPPDIALPQPQMVRPETITAPVPDVVIRTDTHPIAATPPAAHVPPSAVPAPPAPVHADGKGRSDFIARLLAQLNRFKRYPLAARRAHIQGVVMLHFVMDAAGKVTAFNIAKSSGYAALDDEALALIQRAQPLPALPADYPTRTLDAVVPVEFSLNG